MISFRPTAARAWPPRLAHVVFSVSVGLGACIPAASLAAPVPGGFDYATTPGRLPKAVVPLSYVLDIKPDVERLTFAGHETVRLRADARVDRIVMNAIDLTLANARLDGRPVRQIETDAAQQTVTLRLDRPLPKGPHRLEFGFAGALRTGTPGFFAQSFVKPDGHKDVLVTTKFEPTHARRLFPCWDEPAFRAIVEMHFTGPSNWQVVANMPPVKRTVRGALATTIFAPTPRMPTYLVELTAGDLARVHARAGHVDAGIWAVRGQEEAGRTALDAVRQVLVDYEDYFDARYPLPKLDSLAIPGGFAGAMENWGAITYNDQLLLITPASTLEDRQRSFAVIAHEMAHQWNGDLVTMGWWDDLWLNESFASWRAAKETDERYPEWHWSELQDAARERAMRADARSSSHAIQVHVTDDTQAQAAFDSEITYDKGESVLRMLEAYMGPDAFRAGVRRYMKLHALSNATSADLWAALGRVGDVPIERIAADWTTQPGFPLVNVDTRCDADGRRTLTLTQRRLLLRGDPAPGHWKIPLQLRSGAGEPQAVLFDQDGQTLAAGHCDEALSVNANGLGYYRARYDAPTASANREHAGSQPWGDRIAELDDDWALVQAGLLPLADYLAVARTVRGERDERAWEQVLDALGIIEFAERGQPGHEAFLRYARDFAKPLRDAVGWNATESEAPTLRKLRRAVLTDLGEWGDPDVVAEARRRFSAFVADPGSLAPDEQEIVLGTVAAYADEADFERLHTVARSARNETELRRWYAALMKVHDPALAQKAAAVAVSDEIPAQAALIRLRLVSMLANQHGELAWRTLQDQFETLFVAQGQYRHLILAQNMPTVFWASVPLSELESWIQAHLPPGLEPNLARGMETARFRYDVRTALVDAADRITAN